MAKSLKSIYFDSELLIEAEKLNIKMNDICNEALRVVLNSDSTTGEAIRKEAELRKDNNTMRKIEIGKNSRVGAERWGKAVKLYAQKYEMNIVEVLRKFQK